MMNIIIRLVIIIIIVFAGCICLFRYFLEFERLNNLFSSL